MKARLYLAVLPAAMLLGGCVAVPVSPYDGAAVYPAQPVYSPYYAYPSYPAYPAYSYPSSSLYFGYSSGWGRHGRWR
ncbi:MAG TPA: hypothetical protein VE092_14845 [Herbaspirillum sp.]|uniref:hypothetical protein n=1 Tax=Herbaspirillum sp. TaxID=1890675 RepID=UPI002D71947F|nr:hypothetical protein [Herbaspirillum sp.]HZG21287.1 hypothetical protein [Herbaspirillum sp.]